MDKLLQMFALLAGGPRKFHSHADLGVHYAHQAFRSTLELCRPHDQGNSRARGKRRSYLQVATAQAEVGKFARSRWIIRLYLWRMLSQPCLELLALFRRNIHKANARLWTTALPCHFCRTFDTAVGSGQSKFDTHGTGFLSTPRQFERHAA